MTQSTTGLVEELLERCIDYDGKPMHDDELPRSEPTCRDIRQAATTIAELVAALERIQQNYEKREGGMLFVSELARLALTKSRSAL